MVDAMTLTIIATASCAGVMDAACEDGAEFPWVDPATP